MHSPRIVKNIAVVSITFLLVTGCTPGAKTSEQTTDSTQVDVDSLRMRSDSIQSITPTPTDAPQDTIQITELGPEYNDPEWDDSLKKYFTSVQIIRIKLAKEQFQGIATAHDLAWFYRITLPAIAEIMETQINAITPTEMSGDDSPAPHWAWFPRYFPVLSSDVLAVNVLTDLWSSLVRLRRKLLLHLQRKMIFSSTLRKSFTRIVMKQTVLFRTPMAGMFL